jgi:hypothetical protein
MEIQTPSPIKLTNNNVSGTLEWNPNFAGKWNGRFSKAQKYVDSEVLRLSDKYTPFQSGMLKKSGILGTVIGSGTIEYNAIYARYQYYGKVMVGPAPKKVTDKDLVYTGGPMRGSFWFERMKIDHKKQILAGAGRIAGGNS